MTLDQRLTAAARWVADEIASPVVDVDGIRARARRDRRRRASLAVAAVVVAVVAVGASVGRPDGSAPDPVEPAPTPTTTSPPTPETPNPFPTSMTPEQVVQEPRAALRTVAVAPDDPDTRISMWSLQCTRPCPEKGPFEFTAIALTTDGYETTTYLRPPFSLGVDLQVSSPASGVFLVVDMSNGGEWLVDAAEGVRGVSRIDSEIRPADPRWWFQCAGQWRCTWCALDPDSSTAHAWPKAWDGSAASPAVGDLPWGANPKPRSTSATGRLEAWWDTDQGRQVTTLATVTEGDYILGSPPGEMAYWARADADTMDIYTSRNRGADWDVDTRAAPGMTGGSLQLRRSPGGALLAYSIYPRLEVWRAEASGGPFEKVYEQSGEPGAETTGAGLWLQDGLVYANAFARAVVSDDDGLTWTTIETWSARR